MYAKAFGRKIRPFLFPHICVAVHKKLLRARNCVLFESDRLRDVFSAVNGAIAPYPSEPTCKTGKAYLWRLVLLIIYCAFQSRAFEKAHPGCRILTAFEERVNLRDFNNYSRKQNHAFAQRNPICKYFCFWEEGEFFAINTMCALKRAKKREKPPSCRQVSPFLSKICFICLKQILRISFIPLPPSPRWERRACALPPPGSRGG